MKNFKGGYKIVSLNGNDLTSESAFTIKGIYEDLEDSYSKPILVSEIVINGVKEQDAYAVVKKTESGYTIEVYGYALTVTDEDSVTSTQITLDAVTSIGGVSGDITLGEGLAITEEGELSASGGGGSTLYMHNISIFMSSPSKVKCSAIVISSSNEKINTAVKLATAVGEDVEITAGGYVYIGETTLGVIYKFSVGPTYATVYYFNTSTNTDVYYTQSKANFTYSDTVVQIQ